MTTQPPNAFENVDLLPQRQLTIASIVPAPLWYRFAKDANDSLKIGSFQKINGLVAQIRIYGPANPQTLDDFSQNTPSVMAIAYNTLYAYLISALNKVGALVCELSMTHLTAIFPVDGDSRSGYIYSAVKGVEDAVNALTGKTPPGYPDIHWYISSGISYGSLNLSIVGNEFIGRKIAVVGGQVKMHAEDALDLTRRGQIVLHRSAWKRLAVNVDGEWLSEDYFLPSVSVAESHILDTVDPAIFALPKASNGTPPVTAMQMNRLATFIDSRIRAKQSFTLLQKGQYQEKICALTVRLGNLALNDRTSITQWQSVMENIFDIATRYGGFVSQVSTELGIGNIQIVFGLPQSQDFVERRAARCALALNRSLSLINTSVQIGIAAGNGFAALLGTRFYSNYVPIAPAIERSTQLAERAETREVLSDSIIEAATSDLFTWREQQYKLSGKHKVYALAGEVSLGSGLNIRHRTTKDEYKVGRFYEREQISEFVSKAKNGDGQFVVVTGDGGNGRSAIIDLFIDQWLETPGNGFVALGPTFSPSAPYSLWRPIWQAIFDLEVDEPVRQKKSKLAQAFSRIMPDADGGVSIFANLLGLDVDEDISLAYLMPDARHRRVFDATRAMLDQLTDNSPVLIIFEHTEYSDDLSLNLIGDLFEDLKDKPIIFCLEDRRSVSHTLTRKYPTAKKLIAKKFTSAEAWELINYHFNNLDLPYSHRQVLEQLLGDGKDKIRDQYSPMFVMELINLFQSQFLHKVGDKWKFKSDYTSQDIPRDETEVFNRLVQSVISKTDRQILSRGAVSGISFPHHAKWITNKAVSGTSATVEIEKLEELGLVQRYADSGTLERWSRFRHDPHREILYQQMDTQARSELHQEIIDWYKDLLPGRAFADTIAAHAERAMNSPLAVDAYLKAAEFAADWGAVSESMQHLLAAERHLARAKKPDPKLMLKLSLTRTNLHLAHGFIEKGIKEADTALNYAARADSPSGKARSLLYRARFAQLQEDYKAMLNATTRAIKFANASENIPIITEATWLHAKALMHNHERRKAIQLLLTSLDTDQLDENEFQLEMRLDVIRILMTDFHRERANEQIKRLQKHVETLNNPVLVHQIMGQLGRIRLLYGDTAEALNVLEKALTLPSPPKDGMLPLAEILENHGIALCYAGRYMDAEAIFEASIDYYIEEGKEEYAHFVEIIRAYEHHVDQSDWDTVASVIDKFKNIDYSEYYHADEIEVLLQILHAKLIEQDDKWLEAVSIYESLMEHADNSAKRWYMPGIYCYAGEAAIAQGDYDKAAQLAYQGLGAVGIQGDIRYLCRLYTVLAETMIVQGKFTPEAIGDALQRAIDAGRAHARRLHLAQALLINGHYLHDTSQKFRTRALSNKYLFEAEQLYHEMGIEQPTKDSIFNPKEPPVGV